TMPFGLKVPSKNTLIFSGVAGGIAGLVYSSNKYAQDARTRLSQRVSFLADRPCGVHEMPRKVTVYITAPPGDGLEKSRTWFREYVKPILVAGAVDCEIKEAKSPGQIETSVMEEIVQRRREAAEAAKNKSNTGFTTPVDNMNNKKKSEVVSDGILGIGRNANREVLSGLAKG
ncbi:mitochondrial import inner membrane translocase subunit Tim54, partial [Mucor mucedo]|uniref:mitochondrial import inner membrane translocase subunit Tim54 n=1 Tax=Mucor mucedo TaxID=29922 RepID=UPI00221E80E3